MDELISRARIIIGICGYAELDDIAYFLKIGHASAAEIIKVLQDEGYIAKEFNPNWRRMGFDAYEKLEQNSGETNSPTDQ